MIIGTGIVISSTVLGCTILVAAIVVAMITKYELTHDAEQDFFDTKKKKDNYLNVAIMAPIFLSPYYGI